MSYSTALSERSLDRVRFAVLTDPVEGERGPRLNRLETDPVFCIKLPRQYRLYPRTQKTSGYRILMLGI
jgi:hypothetical protein